MSGNKVWAGGERVLESTMRELQETREPEKQASLCRRLATQIASGVESGAVDPFAGVSLMEEYIRDANSLVDDQDGLNNYADAILTEQDRFKNHSKDWKSSLTIDHPSIQRFIERHNGQPEGPREDSDLLRCIKTKPDDSLKLELERSVAELTSSTMETPMVTNNVNQMATSTKETPMDTMPDFDIGHDELLDLGSEDAVVSNQCKMPTIGNRENVVYPEVTIRHQGARLEGEQQSVRGRPLMHPVTQHAAKSSTNKPLPSSKAPEAKAGGRQLQSEAVGGSFGGFRTAQQQLILERQKAGSKGNRGNFNTNSRGWEGAEGITSNSYGSAGRTLGTRPGPATGFKPPVRQNEHDLVSAIHGAVHKTGGAVKPQGEEEEDPRYKNIDSKMVEMVKNEIMDQGEPVVWDDIAGLKFAKKTVQEMVVLPLKRPDIFNGLRGPPKGLLLFGPPGTGKTLIGKCIASQSGSTFFSISASSLTSKWVGEGEKMVRALFAVAKVHEPSVIFIDEIDSLLTARSDSDHESSRRIKTEFLVQLDGANSQGEERVLVVGATNRPQELDEAARRRLVKRLYIPLPEGEARRKIISNLLAKERNSLTETEVDEVVDKTEGYSGADMANLCKEAAMGPIRSLDFNAIDTMEASQVRPIEAVDFVPALRQVKASVSQDDLDIYLNWDKQYGATG